jgi:voltage-gated potassium channel
VTSRETDPRDFLYRRLVSAFMFLITIVGIGTVGLHYLGEGRWGFWDCFYMTVITLSTVGFGETLSDMDQVVGARAFTVSLIVLGSGTLLYFASSLTAFIVEGDLMGALKRNRMQKDIDKLARHIVVCGVGATGVHIISELLSTGTPFVAIDLDVEHLERLGEELGVDDEIPYVPGDATDDHTLERAGIARAKGLIAALHDDKDNVFVTITARALNPNARIVAKAIEPSADPKLRRAGADAVVSPYRIGGMRMVSEMVRPRVVEFLDLMLRDRERNMRIEEIAIPDDAPIVGVALRDTNIRKKTDALVIAVRDPEGSFVYNPPPSIVFTKGMTLVVLAETGEYKKLRSGIRDGSIGPG